jgi:rhodanese-related sulfurtransferase
MSLFKESCQMAVILVVTCALLLVAVFWIRRRRAQRQLEEHSITPDALHSLLSSNREVLVYDVRLPLDVLAESEIIPGANRVSPKEIIANPAIIPSEKDAVVYCTCPSEETSREKLQRALALGFSRVKFLKGGLAGWKAKGFPVEPYTQTFHLDTGV